MNLTRLSAKTEQTNKQTAFAHFLKIDFILNCVRMDGVTCMGGGDCGSQKHQIPEADIAGLRAV